MNGHAPEFLGHRIPRGSDEKFPAKLRDRQVGTAKKQVGHEYKQQSDRQRRQQGNAVKGPVGEPRWRIGPGSGSSASE